MEFASGKEAGTTFEKVFERHCQLAGLWADQNHTRARRGWGGKLKEMKSNLDFTLIRRDGAVGVFDCKTFDTPHFDYSAIPEHQRELAARYNEWGITSGFVVWFRPINAVVFFAGWLVKGRGPGTRFLPQDGRPIGSWERLDPTKLLPNGFPSGIVR